MEVDLFRPSIILIVGEGGKVVSVYCLAVELESNNVRMVFGVLLPEISEAWVVSFMFVDSNRVTTLFCFAANCVTATF